MNAGALQPVFLLHSEVRLDLSISLNLILDRLIILSVCPGHHGFILTRSYLVFINTSSSPLYSSASRPVVTQIIIISSWI